MKVVLKADVRGTGKKDDLVIVSDGYARNYLLPRGLAVAADSAALNEVHTKADARAYREKQELERANALAEKINKKEIVIHARAGQGGRLFGAVTSRDIAEALRPVAGETIDKRRIELDGEIKNYGHYEVPVKVWPGVTAKVYVTVGE